MEEGRRRGSGSEPKWEGHGPDLQGSSPGEVSAGGDPPEHSGSGCEGFSTPGAFARGATERRASASRAGARAQAATSPVVRPTFRPSTSTPSDRGKAKAKAKAAPTPVCE